MASKNRKKCFEDHVAEIHKQLGIGENYRLEHQLALQPDCTDPVSIGRDIFDREQTMLPAAARAWSDMKEAAALSGVDLQVVSAYRPLDYQVGILQRKLNSGQCIEDILKVSAAPGYSEHHSGRALDITTPGFRPLEEEFENSPAFHWLNSFADNFGFKMSYPRDNIHEVAYEPWHWCWSNRENEPTDSSPRGDSFKSP